MKESGDKGQSALEYLMTYGWAILVVLGVGLAMWQMGVFSGSPSTAKGKNGFEGITPLDWAMKTNGQMALGLSNDAGTYVQFNGISATVTSPAKQTCNFNFGSPPNNPDEDAEFRPGEKFPVIFRNCGNNSGLSGEYWRATVNINYKNMQSGMGHISVGEVWGPIE
ncbi:hypothetical protein ACFLRC_04950 [Candidatus Altiarchaeota archaeon]